MRFISDPALDSIALNVTDDVDHLWGKTRQALEYIHENHLNDYDWFLKADDDTYVIVENLRYMLHQFSTESPIYFGSQFQAIIPEMNYRQVSPFQIE